mgnify:CR=1 FL=1
MLNLALLCWRVGMTTDLSLSYNSPIQLVYVEYATSDLVFEALDRGDVHMTSAWFAEGGFVGNERRKIAFSASCQHCLQVFLRACFARGAS